MDTQLKAARSIEKVHKNKSDEINADLRVKKRIVEGAQNAKMKLYEELIAGSLSKEDYLSKKKALTGEEESAKEQIDLLKMQKQLLENQQSIERSAILEKERMSRFSGITKLNESLLKELVQKVIIYPDNSIRIVWNFRDITEDVIVDNIASNT